MGGCVQNDQEPAADGPGVIASGYLSELSDMGGRVTGTDKEESAGNWIRETLEEMGYQVTVEPFDYNVEGVSGSSENIIAVKEGTSEETVILGAHYDSVDVGDGVDDNASGIAVVLEAAKALKDAETPQTIQFIFFGAEEVGLCGSDYHATQMTQEEIDNVALAIAAEKNLELTTQPGENPEFPAGTTGDWSDHAPFKGVGIPYMYFESTNWELGAKDGYTQVDLALGVNGEIWHTEYDTLDYINENFPDRIENRLKIFTTVTLEFLQDDLSAV